MKLIHANGSYPGYTRIKRGVNFIFLDNSKKIISSETIISRIKKLAIPPAWTTNVWICAKENGHLQATGIDSKGRKQYIYHAKWSKFRNEVNHTRMYDFGRKLPKIRSHIQKDLNGHFWNKTKVLALAVNFMQNTYIRIGSPTYTQQYGSFGLSTLRNKHIKVIKNKIVIRYKGKHGIMHEQVLTHTRLVSLLKKLRDLPGQELFQYYEPDGITLSSIDSNSINEYIKALSGKEYSAKDFRTWAGTLLTFKFLIKEPFTAEKPERKRILKLALEYTAQHLGNTVKVCKKHYVHPGLIQQYEDNGLKTYINKFTNLQPTHNEEDVEKLLVHFLKRVQQHSVI